MEKILFKETFRFFISALVRGCDEKEKLEKDGYKITESYYFSTKEGVKVYLVGKKTY